MYLKKLEIHGFKSFAEKVEIDFKKGITGIVGPNGSGKSNIIDAVRWVLGEQSAKTLRGSKMEDIIFNGTNHRKPLGMAEVSLSFDNGKKILPIDYSEVTITRRIYRSGESEYLINKTPCRLKDIKELLMDTGIGIDGYSLIGQGQIDSILSTKAEERRQIFEEAAGIVKYKSRKAEAEKKLENTCQNLVRIEDIIYELESRIEPLKNQSIKAKKYLKLSKELKDLELNLFLNEIDEIKFKLKSEHEQFSIVENQLENYIDKKEILIEKQSDIQLKIDTLDNDIKNMKNNYFEISNAIKKLEGDKVLYKEKIQNIEKNIVRIAKEIDDLEIQNKEFKRQLEVLLIEKNTLDKLIEKNNKILEFETSKYEFSNSSLSKDEVKIENLKSEVIEILNNISSAKSEINGIKTLKENVLKRIKKIEEEKLLLENKESELNKNIQSFEKEIENLNKSILDKKNENINLYKKNNEIIVKYNDLLNIYEKKRNNLRDIQSEKKLLEAMDKSYEGFNNSVKKTLEMCNKNTNIGKGVHGVVAELINIPNGLEIAIEVALGYSMQYIICNDQEDAKRIIKYLKINNLGRVTFLPLSNIFLKSDDENSMTILKSFSGIIGIANELIECSDEYKDLFKYLLGRTIIVDKIDTAINISKIIKKYKIVTLEGDIINPGGTITGGSYNKSKISNIFSRKRKIKELNKTIEKLKNLTIEFEQKISVCKNELIELEQKIKLNEKEIEDFKILLLKKENSYNNFKSDLNTIKLTKTSLNNEYRELQNDLKDIEISIKEKKSKIIYLEEQNSKLSNDINKELELLSLNHSQLENLKEEITSIKITLASLKEKKENIINEINRIKKSIDICFNDKNNKEIELKNLKQNKESLCKELQKIILKIKDNNILFKQIEYNINKFETEKNNWLEKNKSSTDQIESINKTINELKDSLHKIEVRKTRLEIQKESIIKKIWEKYELSLIDALKYKTETEIEDYSKISDRINYLKDEIKYLGRVNIDSIKEYEEIMERYTFLNSQKKDLIQAKESLNKVISELENTMKKQFVESFNEINKNFSNIFNQLFNGGKAKLLLKDDSNVLESNIEIIAQPPGKKLQNLNLLSGGEKALTAIALLFSILKTKPTPFCILDEIEAALDDVNIFRFADFLKEFSKNSQFIVITHRKGTMEIIDYLYGITMQEYGVSKVIAIKLSERAS